MTNSKKIIIYSLINVMLFLFLIYFYFPRTLIKETVISQIQSMIENSGMPLVVNAESVEPYFFTGLEVKNFSITNKYDKDVSIKLKSIALRLDILPLLIGLIRMDVYIHQNNDSIKGFISTSVLNLLKKEFIPNKLLITLSEFEIKDFLKILFGNIKYSSNISSDLIKPVIADSEGGGKLNGTILFYKESKILKSLINVKIDRFFIDFKNPMLGIPLQDFSTAYFSLTMDGPSVLINGTTALKSQDMKVLPSGTLKIPVNSKLPTSMEVVLNITFGKALNDSIGYLVPQLLKCNNINTTSGYYHLQLIGNTSHFACI